PETLDRTSLKKLSAGSQVNLERALSATARFGGHIVTGHIDGTARIAEIRKDDNAVIIRFACPEELMTFIIEKGSVAVDGISLTVASLDTDSFTVSVIPHTGKQTTLLTKKTGDIVNIENDILGKYVERFTRRREQPAPAPCAITEEYLREKGF
ncbi:MAG: riboflavin synthase, partial [Methanocorpusculum sp.]|nr:riboflavin synthase [Methanocorpusculum sp.]